MDPIDEVVDAIHAYRHRADRPTLPDLFLTKHVIQEGNLWQVADRLNALMNREKDGRRAGQGGGSAMDKSSSQHFKAAREVVEKYVAHQQFAAAHKDFQRILTQCREEIATVARERDDQLSRPIASHSFGGRRGEEGVTYAYSLGSSVNTLDSVHGDALRNTQEVVHRLAVAVHQGYANAAVHGLTAAVTQQSQYLESALHAMRASVAEARRRHTGGKLTVREVGQRLESRRPTPPSATDPWTSTAAAAAMRITTAPATPAATTSPRPPTPTPPAHLNQRTSDPRGPGRR
ncbi:hypothetical protein [Streptomyces zaehneri]|uniref:hypothetical protein n=1 Tax=Streptomyces zaehneri TaxID=3051180 RepID=UPI0028D29FD8|nr:hypothetical protein [Streptomyces sp. DSM 40713]